MNRTALLAGAALVLSACTESGTGAPTLPAHAKVYRQTATILTYNYTDRTGGGDLELNWIPSDALTPYNGLTCLQFAPRLATDTTGNFYFVRRGENTGFLERRVGSTYDTVPGYFLTGREGTRGTYVERSNGRVTLTWTDGVQSRYFDPTAVMTFTGDSLISEVQLSYVADSIRAYWRVGWLRGTC